MDSCIAKAHKEWDRIFKKTQLRSIVINRICEYITFLILIDDTKNPSIGKFFL